MNRPYKIHWSFVCITIVLALLLAFNDSSADSEYYLRIYQSIGHTKIFFVEPGYIFLCTFFKNLGFSFIQFKVALSIIVFLLIGSTVLRYSKYPSLVLICFFFYPFLLDCAQLRHLFASSIFVFSIRFLERFSLKNLICYIVFIALASTIQMIALAFSCFLLLYIIKDKRSLYKIVITGIFILFFLATAVAHLPFIRYLMDLRGKGDFYNSGIPFGQLILYLAFFLSLVIVAIKRDNIKGDKYTSNFLQKFSMLSLIFLPILLVDFQFTRLFRACLIPIYISCWNNVADMKFNYRMLVGGGMLMILALVFNRLFIASGVYYKTLTYPILFDNLLLR